MCGIAGVIGGSTDYSPHLADMMRAMAHRGPDGQGTLAFEGGAVGAVRLAFLDLSDRGQQPLWSPDKRVAIIFNGEIYNHAAERERLAAGGYPFRSSSDTEVILALYLQHGLEFVHYLRGMYALAILDWRESVPGGRPRVIFARDPFGIKPLYFCRPDGPSGPLVFASELRTLLASGLVKPEIDREGLTDYLAVGFVLQPRTILAGVKMLERGSLLEFSPDREVTQKTFWRMPRFNPVQETLDQAAERLRHVLEESVALHAMADVPVGAFLSGGVDSTGMVGLMIRKNPRLRTYTLRFPDLSGADEADKASAYAASLGCDHTIADVTSREVVDLVPRFAAEIDQPSVDGFNTWLISRAAARDVKGVISGLGGDEWFAGYASARVIRDFVLGSRRAYVLPAKVARAVRGLAPQSPLGRRLDGLATKADSVATWIDCHRVFGYLTGRQLAGSTGARDHDGVDRVVPLIDPAWKDASPVALASLLDVAVYMGCQLLRDSDATSMASSLELRVPLVDLKVAEFAQSCAEEFKLGDVKLNGNEYGYAKSGSKRVLIHALRDILPPDILERSKQGFGLPFDHWARNGLQTLIDETSSREAVKARGLLDPDLVTTLRGSERYWSSWPQAWSLMILELWCRSVIDNAKRQ
ncbi:MAG TPA: asparagine synthase (glutamine-hydrolyzing) [Pyrinomonadaceae bacterium]|nr:asparagine synthase (glutamine-hydrolyzing) [Pyrinomonadaceae bacterium]